jgi:trimeric autotransporter adhesin
MAFIRCFVGHRSSLNLTASENTTGIDRSATVTLSATSLPNVVITVKQVAKLPLTISVIAQNKAYDGNNAASVTVSNVSGKLFADVVTVNAAGHFNNKNAGTNKTVTVNITLSGADAGNYSYNTQATTTANISKIPLTVDVSAKNKAYDGSTTAQANTSITSGLLNGDNVSVVATGNFNNKNVGNRSASFSISLTGTDAGNYTAVTPVTVTAMITAAELGIHLNVQNKVYDGTTNAGATASIVSGLVTGEDVTVTVNSCSFEDKMVSDNAMAHGTVSISGADADNYYFNNYVTSSAKISPLTLTIALNAENKTYNGNTNVNLTATITSGLFPGDVVTATANGAFVDKNAGAGKTVNANIYLSGKDMSNYTISSTGTTTADISPLALVVTAEGIDKEYDGNNNAYIHTYVSNGPLPNDAVTVNATGNFENKNTGTGKTININISLSGADAGNYTCNSAFTTAAAITKANLTSNITITPDKEVYTGGVPVTITAVYSNAIDVSEGAPSISLKSNEGNTVATMTSTDRKTWTYQWTPPVTGHGTIGIRVALEDVASNFNQISEGKTLITYENSQTGVSNVFEHTAIKAYPTINDGLFYIAMDNPDQGAVKVQIVNMSGLVIKECQFIKTSSSAIFEIRMDNAGPGVYLVEIEMNHANEIRRVIKALK